MTSYAQFYTLLKQTNADKEALIADFTGGRTTSIRELSTGEYNALCASLRKSLSPTPAVTPSPSGRAGVGLPSGRAGEGQKADKMRKAIISYFYQMDYDNPVLEAKQWAEKMGARGVKRRFNDYDTQELFILLSKAQQALNDYKMSIRKHLKKD